MGKWFIVKAYRGHIGRGGFSVETYIFGENAVDVLQKYRKMPGVQRSKTPTITLLSDEDGLNLEKLIEREGRISLDKARKSWYYRRIFQ